MNVALPALIVFFLLLPGFVIRTRLKRAERTSLDYSPFGQVVAEAVLWACIVHMAWLLASWLVFKRSLDPQILLKLLSSDASSQARSAEAVGTSFGWVSAYFITLLLASFLMPKLARTIIMRFRLDRRAAPLAAVFRFHDAPWYYLLTGADFKDDEQPDAIIVSAIVNIAGQGVLYTGFVDEFFFTPDGALDRLVLKTVMRRPISADKQPDGSDPVGGGERFYPVDGDYFVLRYSEAITLNIQYVRITRSSATAGESV